MQETIKGFWESHPCGAELVGDLNDETRAEYEDFFRRYDEFRYSKEPHILTNLDRIDLNGKRVLEIGLGQGADAEQIVKRGGIYNGVDLTGESVKRVRMRFELHGLPHETITQASALDLPFDDGFFDIVYSFGVLHHIPDVRIAQAEIARVLMSGGRLYAMLYAKWSLNYLGSISIARRLGLAAMCALGMNGAGVYRDHLANARDAGIANYLRMKNFINVSTDGPFNPYSKVYGRREIEEDFPNFEIERIEKQFMHAPPLPVAWLPLEGTLGWHLWVRLAPRNRC